jgi:hypothetical protein
VAQVLGEVIGPLEGEERLRAFDANGRAAVRELLRRLLVP